MLLSSSSVLRLSHAGLENARQPLIVRGKCVSPRRFSRLLAITASDVTQRQTNSFSYFLIPVSQLF